MLDINTEGEGKMKKIMILIIVSLLVCSLATAWNWQETRGFKVQERLNLFTEDITSLDKIEDRLEAQNVLSLVNSNDQALSLIERSGIDCLTVKTEDRNVNLAYEEGYIVEDDGTCRYYVTTTEEDLNTLWNDYNSGNSITMSDIKSSFDIPMRLYWKVIINIWG